MGSLVAGALCSIALTLPTETVPAQVHAGVLVDPSGYMLYTYEQDPPGQSRCSGFCAEEFPPLRAFPEAREACGFTILSRDDGTRQWAYRGRPLYRYRRDRANDLLRDDRGSHWRIVRIAGGARATAWGKPPSPSRSSGSRPPRCWRVRS